MKKFFIKNLYPTLIVIIVFIICLANYTPGTILSGWDTIHPEFNFGEYFSRIFFGVWQQHQGVGALATQAHASEIPRVIIYYLMSFLLPLSFLRYAYFFLTLFLGPLGTYFFLKEIILKNSKKAEVFSFLGALFYLLNLVTVQQYIVPFEMFATHFASLPWLFYFMFKFLIHPEKKNLIYFTFITLLASSIAHTATLWYSYFFSLVIFLLTANLLTRNKKFLKNSLIVILATVLTNLFWILPDLYFAKASGSLVSLSKIHSLFTEEAFAQNVVFGKIPDFLIFKNFLFNWGVYAGNWKFDFLLTDWRNHLNRPLILSLGYLFSAVFILGIISAIKSKNKTHLAFLSIFFVSFFFWFNINPPLGFLFSFLQKTVPLFQEAFRFPFTKFSILLVFICSIYFSLGLSFIYRFSNRVKPNNFISQLLLLSFTLMLIVFSFPAFKGNLISPYMKVKIPNEYFQMFSWFNEQEPNGRVASLPINSFWGWSYYNWGYQGAGFLWFGIKQPLLDREFDRWNPKNEQYYREMSQAVYTKDAKLFSQVLEKYNIKYILVDKSVISPDGNSKVLFFNEIDSLLKKQNFSVVNRFGQNLFVYTIKSNSKPIFLLKNPVSVSPLADAYYEDFAFEKYHDYITLSSGNVINYPFRTEIDNQNHFLPKTTQELQGVNFTLDAIDSSNINLPQASSIDDFVPTDIVLKKNQELLQIEFYPNFPLKNIKSSPNPLLINAQVPNENSFLLSINENEVFTVSSLSENTPYILGKTFLNTKRVNSVSVYSNQDLKQITPVFSSENYSFFICGSGNNNPVFGVNQLDRNSFSLIAKGAQICMINPLSKILAGENLDQIKELKNVLISTSFNFSGKIQPTLCIADLKDSRCLYYFSKNIQLSTISSKQYLRYFAFNGNDVNNLGLKIFIDSRAETKQQTDTFENFQIFLPKHLFSASINPEDLQNSLKAVEINSKPNLEVEATYSGNEQLSQDITKLPRTSGDCPSSNPRGPQPTNKQIVKEESRNFIRYSSQDGSFCDHFSYQSLPQNQSYLISITSRNVEGLPIRLCVTNNVSTRCDIYTHLGKNTDFKEEVFLLPPMNGGQGFDININNFAIKGAQSINDLKSISVIPIPYNWLSEISVGKIASPSLGKTFVENFTHPNSSLYVIESLNLNGDVLALSQSFDQGWHAYKVSSTGFFTKLLPFLFGKELGRHIEVNNWENGWQISEPFKGKEAKIIIVYLPQYLEYFGLLLGLSSFVFIVLKGRKYLT